MKPYHLFMRPSIYLPQGIRVIVLALLILFGVPAGRLQAQSPTDSPPSTPLRFAHLSLEEGLSQSAVLAIWQDSQGFMWFGTQDGLNRYDGYTFTVFRYEPENPNSLSHSAVISIFEDSAGMLWLGTWGGGLNRYDPRTGQFTRYRHDPANPTSLSHDLVAAITEDSHGNLWLGTMGGGLNRLNRATGQFEQFRHDAANPASLSSDYVSVIFEDADGMLWVGTGGFNVEGAGLNRLDPATGQFTHYQFEPDNPKSLSGNTISAIQQDKTGMLWIGTGGFGLPGHGLNRFDPHTGAVTRYQHNPDDPASPGSDDVMSVYLDATDTLWVGAWDGGLDQADLTSGTLQFRHHRHDPLNATSLRSNRVWAIRADRSGVLWVGTVTGGLNKFDPQVQRFRQYHNDPDDPHSLGFDVVGPFYEDRRGGFWVGTWGGGLDYFDRATGRFTHYVYDPANPAGLSDSTVTAMGNLHRSCTTPMTPIRRPMIPPGELLTPVRVGCGWAP